MRPQDSRYPRVSPQDDGAAGRPHANPAGSDPLFEDEPSLDSSADGFENTARSRRLLIPETELISVPLDDPDNPAYFPEEVSFSDVEPAIPAPSTFRRPATLAGQTDGKTAVRKAVTVTPLGLAALSIILIAAAVAWLRYPMAEPTAASAAVEHVDVLLPPVSSVPPVSSGPKSQGTSGSLERTSQRSPIAPKAAPLTASKPSPPAPIVRVTPARESSPPRVASDDARVEPTVPAAPAAGPAPAPVPILPETSVAKPTVPAPARVVEKTEEKRAAAPIPDEPAAIRAALGRYAAAYTDLDAAAVSAVWPSVDRAALSRAFSSLDAQQVRFDRCAIEVSGATGRANCVGTAMWLPKIGGKGREQDRTWNFVLKNAGGTWHIVTAEAR